jgi:4-amino-4-deoxy-L-arabinose transferase-like glycosyltransferase
MSIRQGRTLHLVKSLSYFAIACFILLGLFLRLAAYQDTVIASPIRADAADYFNYAKNMEQWGIYSRLDGTEAPPPPDAMRNPGFPAFAALFMADDENASVANVLLAQTILQILVFLLFSFLLIRTLGLAWAVIPVAVLWTFPHFITINTYFLSESLCTSVVALLLSCILLNKYSSKPRLLFWIALGLVIGAGIMVRPTLQYFPFFLLAILVLHGRKIKREYLVMLAVALIPLVVWGARNLAATGKWSDPTLMIAGLYVGGFPMFMYNNDPQTFVVPYRYDPMAEQALESVGSALSVVFERAVNEPGVYIRWYLAGKQFFLWQWNIIDGQGGVFIYQALQSPYYDNPIAILTHDVNAFIHPVWICLAFIGMAIFIRKLLTNPASLGYFWLLTGSVFLYGILIHIPVASFTRYGIPFKVAALLMAVFAVKEIYMWIQQRNPRKLAAP